ncbi:MAG: OmpH family outer membrane protein [Phycisphaerales bacterium]
MKSRGTTRTGRVGMLAGLALGGGLMLGVGGGLGAGLASLAAEPTAVATVDIERVSNELQEFKDRAAALAQNEQSRLEELRAIDQRIQDIETEIEALPADDVEERTRLIIEAQAMANDLRTRQQLYSREAEIGQTELTRVLYDKIVEATAQVAQREGYDIVIFDDRQISLRSPRANDFESVMDTLLTKKVLYSSESVDLTGAVLILMNNEFAAGGSGR